METHQLTTTDIEMASSDERYLGWGYIRGREGLDAIQAALADRVVLRHANELDWDYDDLFHWVNSKCGRWFGDTARDGMSEAALTELTNSLFVGREWDPRS